MTKRLYNKLNYKKLGLFEIVEVKGLINFRLKLLKNIKIYSVFYISLLELVLVRAPRALYTEIDLIDKNKEYTVYNILNYKYIRGKIKYLIN